MSKIGVCAILILTMLSYFWFTFLYQPLFNGLIWIYNNIAHQNLGWAVVWLTIILRVILLPLTIISERNAIKEEKAEAEAAAAAESFKTDRVAQQEAIRAIIKKNKISPWAKVLSLGIQILVFLLLYQVFMRGIIGNQVARILYSFVEYPGKLNLDFYGFAVGEVNNIVWAGVCAIYLFVSIYIEHHDKKHWQGSEVVFLFLFPIFTYLLLWWLPMVKSLFILTTMVFSDIIHGIRLALFPIKKEVKK